MKRNIYLTMLLALLAISCVTVFGYNMVLRTSVQLPASSNEVTSSQYSGNYGQGELSVHSGSAGNAKLMLQYSSGGGWTTLASLIIEPGENDSTNIWGLSYEDLLFRVVVQSYPKVYIGNPGRIATGDLYTGNE